MQKRAEKPDQETSDVRLRLLGYLLLGFVALIAVVPSSLWLFYPNSRERHDVARPNLQSAEPKLQIAPSADLKEYLIVQNQRLSRAGVNPAKPDTFQIPIERAMDLIAARGLNGWPRP